MVIVYGLHVRDNEGNDEVSERETKKLERKYIFFNRGREREKENEGERIKRGEDGFFVSVFKR